MKQWMKYILVFALTTTFFVVAWLASTLIRDQKIAHLQSAQDKVATDILSSETQFDLLQESSCEDGEQSSFSNEIASLADKIAYSEKNLSNTEEILALKKQYTILEVKDFLLAKRIGTRCNHTPSIVLYFYGTKDACPDCVRQGYVLDALRQSHPLVRIYAFDSNLDLSTIRALKTIYKIKDTLPALVVNGTTVQGFQSIDQLESLLSKALPLSNPAQKVK